MFILEITGYVPYKNMRYLRAPGSKTCASPSHIQLCFPKPHTIVDQQGKRDLCEGYLLPTLATRDLNTQTALVPEAHMCFT